jgi:hypothetical protein
LKFLALLLRTPALYIITGPKEVGEIAIFGAIFVQRLLYFSIEISE